jgi:hypothetical protein
LIGKLPDNQILVPFCWPHIAWKSTARASWISSRFDSAMMKPCTICNASPARSAYLLHQPGSDLHRPGSTSHQPESNSHQPESNSHRPESDAHHL